MIHYSSLRVPLQEERGGPRQAAGYRAMQRAPSKLILHLEPHSTATSRKTRQAQPLSLNNRIMSCRSRSWNDSGSWNADLHFEHTGYSNVKTVHTDTRKMSRWILIKNYRNDPRSYLQWVCRWSHTLEPAYKIIRSRHFMFTLLRCSILNNLLDSFDSKVLFPISNFQFFILLSLPSPRAARKFSYDNRFRRWKNPLH